MNCPACSAERPRASAAGAAQLNSIVIATTMDHMLCTFCEVESKPAQVKNFKLSQVNTLTDIHMHFRHHVAILICIGCFIRTCSGWHAWTSVSHAHMSTISCQMFCSHSSCHCQVTCSCNLLAPPIERLSDIYNWPDIISKGFGGSQRQQVPALRGQKRNDALVIPTALLSGNRHYSMSDGAVGRRAYVNIWCDGSVSHGRIGEAEPVHTTAAAGCGWV